VAGGVRSRAEVVQRRRRPPHLALPLNPSRARAGLGLESARVLAARGAEVVIAARDAAKAAAAAKKITDAHPGARVSTLKLDLADLASVKAAAEEFKASKRPLHVLMLNAGVMACPFSTTADGHEMQFGTNQ
jgi:retinol dehydrogenase-12